MKFLLQTLIFVCVSLSSIAIKTIERKIIVDDHRYYYVEFDDDNWTYYLVMGDVNQSVSESEKIELPWGRSLDFPLNQFMWDIHDDTFYCVNTLRHTLNDQSQNIKKVSIRELIDLSKTKQSNGEYIYRGIEAFQYLDNVPHRQVTANYIYQDTYFSDMMIDHNKELNYFTHIDNVWKLYVNNQVMDIHYTSDIILTEQPFFFTIYGFKFIQIFDVIYMMVIKDKSCYLTQITEQINSEGQVFVIQKDEDRLLLINPQSLDNSMSFDDILKHSKVIIQ